MNPQTPNPNGINEVQASQSRPAPGARCHRRTRHGHQCRLRSVSPGGLCFRHASLQSQVKQPMDIDLSGDFAAQLAELKSAEQINDFLGKLLILVLQNRISVRRAAVLAYITNQLLRTVSIMNKEVTTRRRSSATCPAPSLIRPRCRSPHTPICVHDHSGAAF